MKRKILGAGKGGLWRKDNKREVESDAQMVIVSE